jgi:adenylate cyclase
VAFLTAGLCAAILVTAAFAAGLFVDFELRFRDYLLVLSGGAATGPEVVTVVYDDDSLKKLGQWPVSRRVHAELIDALSAAGARVIAFDVLLSEGGGDVDDEALVEAVRRSGRVVLPVLARLTASSPTAPVASSIDRPYGGLVESAFLVGAANVLPDADGVVRAMPLYVKDGSAILPSLAVAAASAYSGRPFRVDRDGASYLGETSLPTDRFGRLLVEFSDPQREPRGVSAAEVLAGRVGAETFKDRLVIVGPVAQGVGDRWLTPFSIIDRAARPGLEIQASAMRTILDGGKWRATGTVAASAMVLVLGGLGALWATAVGGYTLAAGALVLGGGWAGLSWWAFSGGVFLPIFGPLLSLTSATGATVLIRWRHEERERRRIDALFGRFVSEEVAVTLRDTRGRVELGGEEVELTVVFADLRGFTGLAERLPPGDLVQVLDGYLEAMAEGVFAHGGTLDKYTGDGIMAFFNAPTRQPDHARRAVEAAVEILRRVEAFRRRTAPTLPIVPPGVGIGLNTGRAVVGNIGTARRLEYTAVGDEVNLASRLKDLAGAGEILAGRGTVEAAGAGLSWKARGEVEVRGRNRPVEVYLLAAAAPMESSAAASRRRRPKRLHPIPRSRR